MLESSDKMARAGNRLAVTLPPASTVFLLVSSGRMTRAGSRVSATVLCQLHLSLLEAVPKILLLPLEWFWGRRMVAGCVNR